MTRTPQSVIPCHFSISSVFTSKFHVGVFLCWWCSNSNTTTDCLPRVYARKFLNTYWRRENIYVGQVSGHGVRTDYTENYMKQLLMILSILRPVKEQRASSKPFSRVSEIYQVTIYPDKSARRFGVQDVGFSWRRSINLFGNALWICGWHDKCL